MPKIILILAIVTLSLSAQAKTKTLYCYFGLPSFSLEFEPATGQMTWIGTNKYGQEARKVIGTELTMETTSNDPLLPEYKIHVPLADRVLKIVMDFNGSDNDSDERYPMTAYWGNTKGDKPALDGGCATDKIDSVDLGYTPLGELEEF